MTTLDFSLQADGFVGSVHHPQVMSDVAVVVFTGADGGLTRAQYLAKLFADEGITALALAYFEHPELNNTLKLVPLEYIERAAYWLTENTPAKRIALYGISKGAEYALSTAARFSFIESVVAVVPNYYVSEGLDRWKKGAGVSSWSYQDKPLPYLPIERGTVPLIAASLRERQVSIKTRYELSEKNGVPEEAIIPIDRSKARILLLSSSQDSLWPSKHAAEMIIGRLKANDYPLAYLHKNFDPASHLINPMPSKSVRMTMWKIAMQVERRYPDECLQARTQAFELAVKWIKKTVTDSK
jgi:dienelactone hydrolase